MKKISPIAILLVLICSVSSVFAQSRETRNVETFTRISFRVPGNLYLRQGATQKVEIEGKQSTLEEVETTVDGGKLVIQFKGKWNNWHNDAEVKVYVTVKDIEGLSVGGSGDIIAETKLTSKELDLNVSGSGSLRAEVEVSGELEADVSGSGQLEVRGKSGSFNSDVSGSGKVLIALAISGSADLGISGSGKIEASGSAARVKASISGSGKVLASELETNTCEVRISGSGDVEINVKDELDANISGSGSVSYKGNPSKVNSHASGSGRVTKM